MPIFHTDMQKTQPFDGTFPQSTPPQKLNMEPPKIDGFFRCISSFFDIFRFQPLVSWPQIPASSANARYLLVIITGENDGREIKQTAPGIGLWVTICLFQLKR